MTSGGGISVCDALVLVSAFFVYGNSGITCINGLIVEEFLQDYQAGEAVTTWVASVQIALSHISGFLAGTLVELYGNRVVTIAGTFVGALGFILTAYADHMGQLFATYSLLTGVGIGLQFVPALVVPQYVFPKRRTLAVAFILAGGSTGAFVFPVMFNYFRSEYGYRGALLLWAGIMLNSIPLGMLMTMHPQLPNLPLKLASEECENETKHDNDTTDEHKVNCDIIVDLKKGTDTCISNNNESITQGFTKDCQNHMLCVANGKSSGNGYLSNAKALTDDSQNYKLCKTNNELPEDINHVSNINAPNDEYQKHEICDANSKLSERTNCLLNGNAFTVDCPYHEKCQTCRKLNEENISLSTGAFSGDCQKYNLCATNGSLGKQQSLHDDAQKKASDGIYSQRASICGEFRRAFIEMKQGILELHNGSCRVLIAVVFFYACGYMMPYIFLPGKVLQMGLSKTQAAWLVAAIGMSETCSRILAGLIGFIFKKQIVLFYGISMLLSGVGCIGMLLATSFEGFLVVSVVYGAGIGSYVSTYTQAAIAIVGILKIVRIIGLISLAWGIAYMISPSLGACVYEATGNVDVPFYMGSPLQLLAAIIIFCYRFSPMYRCRPSVLGGDLDKNGTEESSPLPPPDVIESSHWSLVSLASDPQLKTQLSVTG